MNTMIGCFDCCEILEKKVPFIFAMMKMLNRNHRSEFKRKLEVLVEKSGEEREAHALRAREARVARAEKTAAEKLARKEEGQSGGG